MSAIACLLVAAALTPQPGATPAQADLAGRIEVLGGPLLGLDAAFGPSDASIWPNAVILGGLGSAWRVGVESRPRNEPGITFSWYAGLAGLPPLYYSGNEAGFREPPPTFLVLATGARIRFANASNYLSISPAITLLPGILQLDPAAAIGMAPLYGQFAGALPPPLEMGWKLAPNCWLSLRTTLPFAALRFEFGPFEAPAALRSP